MLVGGQGRVDLSDARDEAGALGRELLAALVVALKLDRKNFPPPFLGLRVSRGTGDLSP